MDEFKFGVEDVADKLGIEPASARIKLRNAKVKKLNGNKYGWKTKADLDEVVSKLKDTPAAPAKKDGGDKAKASTKKADDKKAPAKSTDKTKASDKKSAGKADDKSSKKKAA